MWKVRLERGALAPRPLANMGGGRVQPSCLSPCASPHAAARPLGGRVPDPTLPGQREVSLQPMPGVSPVGRRLTAETHLSEKGNKGRRGHRQEAVWKVQECSREGREGRRWER